MCNCANFCRSPTLAKGVSWVAQLYAVAGIHQHWVFPQENPSKVKTNRKLQVHNKQGLFPCAAKSLYVC